MVDLDCALWCEYDDGTKEPLALIETARDVGQDYKSATVTARLAMLARLPAYVVLYRRAPSMNPADPRIPDIDQFRVKRLWSLPENTWRIVSPREWGGSFAGNARIGNILAGPSSRAGGELRGCRSC